MSHCNISVTKKIEKVYAYKCNRTSAISVCTYTKTNRNKYNVKTEKHFSALGTAVRLYIRTYSLKYIFTAIKEKMNENY